MEKTGKTENTVVRDGDTVKIHFTCKLEDGTVFDSSNGREPLQFVVGKRDVMYGLERSVIGMRQDESKTFRIPSEDAFGDYRKEKVLVLNRNQLPFDIQPQVGMEFQVEQKDGTVNVIKVTDISESSVTLDANHPLAGKDLIFDVHLIEIIPGNKSKSDEYYRKGVELQDKAQLDEAISFYKKAIELNPSLTSAYYNIAVALHAKGELDKAALFYHIVIGQNPNLPEAHLNLGIVYKEKGNPDESIRLFKKALELKPHYAEAYYNLGNACVLKGQFADAMKYFRQAVEIRHDYAEAHWNIALLNLLSGNFEEGWKGYEWRWKLEGVIEKRDFHKPKWDGSDISGRTILLHAEQGLGDTIQFIRYAPIIAERGAQVTVECQEELVSLLKTVEGVKNIIAKGQPLPEFDTYCPLLSLPLIFNTLLENIPEKIPYINIDPVLKKKWKDRLSDNISECKIGIAWAGDPGMRDDHSRSISLETFSSFAASDKVVYYSLQKGPAAEQTKNPPEGINLLDYTEDFNDFSVTAAFIENLDLIITVDTAIAHLAGAIGKPVWTLIPFVPDWRWMLERQDSPWYPTMRLFRQPSPGDWKSAIEKLVVELDRFIKNNR